MRLCMGCMELIEDGLAVCPRCGYAKEAGVQRGYNLRPGTMLQNRYLLGRVLDWGRYGITYIGYDVSQQRKTAVREYLPVDFAARMPGTKDAVLYPGTAGEQFMAGLSGFLEDGEKWKEFAEIPETVDIYDCFRENSTGYIVMEYLRGNTVKELLEKKKRLSYDEAEKIICHVLAGLSAVHERGIIHGDVVPDNLFITDEGEVRLLGFKKVRCGELTGLESLISIPEPGYAPEEQYRSRGKQGPWTDIYGAGAVFYHMITGIRPTEALERMIKDDLRSPSELGAEIPPKKEAVLMKSLAVRMEDRIQSAEEFRKLLTEKISDEVQENGRKEKSQGEKKHGESSSEKKKEQGEKTLEEKEKRAPETEHESGKPAERKLHVRLGFVCCAAVILLAGIRFLWKNRIGGNDGRNIVSTVKVESTESAENAETTENIAPAENAETTENIETTENTDGTLPVSGNPDTRLKETEPETETETAAKEKEITKQNKTGEQDETDGPELNVEAAQISLGKNHSAVIGTDGSLWMWGRNEYGQLGDGTTENRSRPVKILTSVKSVVLRENLSAAIKTDGSLWMWGRNGYGELGDGTTENRNRPVKILTGVESVSLGEDYSAAVKTDGSLWMWGRNKYSQLGDETAENRSRPVKILTGVESVSLGNGNSAAVKTDGSLWMWGWNKYGQLGEGMEKVIIRRPLQVMTEVKSIILGKNYNAAVKTDGSLWMWGCNEYGQLGNGYAKDSVRKPVKILNEVESVNLGEDYGAAVKTDGSLWMWGHNEYGRLGNGIEKGIAWRPTEILTEVESVSLGKDYSAAVKMDGSLWMWGRDEYSQLGTGYAKDSVRKPTEILSGVKVVSLGEDHSAAVKTDGSLWMWGHNEYGRLGNGIEKDIVWRPAKILS